jgi:hypothetical protein
MAESGNQARRKPLLAATFTMAAVLAFALESGDFTYSINPDTNTVAITGLAKGSTGGTLAIPSQIDGRTVTIIASRAFERNDTVSSAIIPSSMESIGGSAFYRSEILSSVTLGMATGTISSHAFESCGNLNILSIHSAGCTLEQGSFKDCPNLEGIYCHDDAPFFEEGALMGSTTQAKIYYREGTAGWNPFHDGHPTVAWSPTIETPTVGVKDNGSGFGFEISESESGLVIVESNTNLATGAWKAVRTNSMDSSTGVFLDTNWTNFTQRFYRLTMP